MNLKEYKVYICIEDGEVKCCLSERICNTCKYKKTFECKPAIVKEIIGGTDIGQAT